MTFNKTVFAQAERGDKEVVFGGDVTTFFQGSTTVPAGAQIITIPSVSFTNGTLALGLGYYITPQVEVFAGGIVSITGAPTGTNVTGV